MMLSLAMASAQMQGLQGATGILRRQEGGSGHGVFRDRCEFPGRYLGYQVYVRWCRMRRMEWTQVETFSNHQRVP